MTDIVEPDGDLWNWVVQNGGQTKEAIWPSDSETAAWDLATAWTASANALRAALQLSDSAAAELRKVWSDAAGFELFYAIHSLNNGSPGEPGVKEMLGAMDSLSAACRDYGNLIVAAKHAIRKHISDNNELFDRCTSWASRTVFAIQVAHQLSTLLTEYASKVGKPAGEETKSPKKPREGFLGGLVDGLEEVGSFFVGVWEGAVEMFVGFAALAGYGDGHFSWSTFGEAWKGLGKFGLAVATYSTPGLAQLDQTVGLPGFERGEMGSTLVEAGKTMVAWDTWSEDPSRAAGKATFNIASAVLGTKGAGAAIRGAGTAAAGSKVSAVAAAGRVAEKAGTAITKIPTGTELAAKAVRKIPGVDSLLAKVGLGNSPAGVPAHAGDTPPPPHNPRTPDETPPANPPGDRTPDGPPPEGPPNRPPGDRTPDQIPDERRPSRAPEERNPVREPEPSARPEPSPRPEPSSRPDPPTRPEPVTRPEPPTRPGSVGEAMDPGSHRTPGGEQGSPAPKANETPAPSARGENPAASEAPSHHSQADNSPGSPEATGHRARDADEPTATINPETGEVRMSDRVDPADTREHVGLPEKETVRKAQEDWAGSTPVNPQTPRQKALYTAARVLGLVHTVEDAATGHSALPTSKPTDTPPPKESTPKDKDKDKDKAPEEVAPAKSLPDGDPGLPPRHDPDLVDLDLDAGKSRPAEHPDTPPPKGEPELAGQTPSAGAAARAEGPAPETPRPPTRSPVGSGGLWPEPGPRRPGSRMPMGDPFLDRNSWRSGPPIRGGDHPRHPQPARAPDGEVPPPRAPEEHVPPVRDIDSAINPEPARAHPDSDGPADGGHRERDGAGNDRGNDAQVSGREPSWQDRPDENGRTPRQKIADDRYIEANYYSYPGKDGPELRVNPRRDVNHPDYDPKPPPVDLVDGKPRFKSERPPAEFQGFDRERSGHFPPHTETRPDPSPDGQGGDGARHHDQNDAPSEGRPTLGEDVDTRSWRERDYEQIDEKIADRQAKQEKLDETPKTADEWPKTFSSRNDASEVLGEAASSHAIRDRLHRDFTEAFPNERFDVRPDPDAPAGSQRYQIVDADGNVRAEITPRHPTGGEKPGPGSFDHIWEVRYEGVTDPYYIVHEAKGPGGKPSTRYLAAEDRTVRQGHPDYYDDVVAETRKTDPGLADDLERAKLEKRLDYVEIRATVDESVNPHANLGYDFEPYAGFGYDSPLPKPPKPNEE
ncbi:hypothetical protein AB0E55_29995 [Amycolatopsis keratiniphila]|uniref:WXG100-like domain-containing protein n=1 Tax=Amycolatopsis keratiniphila TaxID=129921 RepID=UPI0033E7DA15